MFVFFLLFLSPRYYNKRGILLFILLLVSDALLINYEDQLFNALLFIVRSGIFLTLMGLVINRLRYLKINLFQVIVLILAIGLNISLLYMLVEMVPLEQSYTLSDFLFYVYGFSVIASVTAAVSFRNRFTNKSSIFLLGGVLSLVFSDLTYFIAFNLNFSMFYIVDRIFNMIGIALLLRFIQLDTRSFAKSYQEI